MLVMHDFNLAATASDLMCALNEGRMVAQGAPTEVMNEQVFRETFGVEVNVIAHPQSGIPVVLSQ